MRRRVKRGVGRIVAAFVLVLACVGALFLFRDRFGPGALRHIFASRESVQEFVSHFDPYGPLAFFLIQALQVIVAPVPGNITALAGGALFGLWPGFAISTAGLVTGSVAAFWIARFFGRPIVERLIRPELIDRYIDSVAERHFVLLLLVFLVPFFPDDALCLIAGITALPFHVFLLLVILGRPPGMFFASLVGSGVAVVPWWGWVIIAALSAVALFFAYRFREILSTRLGVESGARNGSASTLSDSNHDAL